MLKKRNKKGNVMISFLLFILALGVVVAFISPINSILDIAQQSDNLNCNGYVHAGSAANALSFNSTMDGGSSGSPIGCIALKLYLPYILLVFLVYGLFAAITGGAKNYFDMDPVQ